MDSAKNTAPADQTSKNRVNKANRKTVAARWNIKTLRGLEVAMLEDPEVDLTTLLSTYSKQLQSLKIGAGQRSQTQNRQPLFPDHDIRSRLRMTDPITIISELSTELKSLLGDGNQLSSAILYQLDESEVLYQGAWIASVMVFRVSEGLVAKVTHERYALTEYRSLSYLQGHLPSFPAPRLHGVVKFGIYYILFTSFIPGLDLEKAWPRLDDAQKHSISYQLETLLSDLRSLPFPANTPLGGVQGQGCKDARRGTRVSFDPIMSIQQFENFIFAGSKTASPLYIKLLRELLPPSPLKIVFTHGDIRPANIMVTTGKDGVCTIAGIVDWDSSGFYPEYWECIKMTNNLTPRDYFDWYRYLPATISQQQYPIQWLVDRIWDRSVENS